MTANFPAVMQQPKDVIFREVGEFDRKAVDIGFRCAHGQHRSVAAAELVAVALRKMGMVVALEHLTIRACGGPAMCDRLSRKNDTDEQIGAFAADALAAHAIADRVWHAV